MTRSSRWVPAQFSARDFATAASEGGEGGQCAKDAAPGVEEDVVSAKAASEELADIVVDDQAEMTEALRRLSLKSSPTLLMDLPTSG